jgi:hypothetical protein
MNPKNLPDTQHGFGVIFYNRPHTETNHLHASAHLVATYYLPQHLLHIPIQVTKVEGFIHI